MTEPYRKPDSYFTAQSEYQELVKQAEEYLDHYFLDPDAIAQSEKVMIRALRTEYLRLKWLQFRPTNVERETLRLIRFFFLRERREKVKFSDYSTYLRSFMKKNRRKMLKSWSPPAEITFDQVIEEMLDRISPPWDEPVPVLTEWIPAKIREAAEVIPDDILVNGGIGKIFRVISGVFLYTLTDFTSETPIEEAKSRIDTALKSGFYFGLLHPLADDIMDSGNHLTPAEKREVLSLMDHWIGGDFSVPNTMAGNPSVEALRIALLELYQLFPPEKRDEFVRLSYYLHFAQRDDLLKATCNGYSFKDIYVPVLLKAACTRWLSCWFSGTKLSLQLTREILETGLVFQLMDDFRDILTDLREGSFTPFTHFYNCESDKPGNPWLIYLRAVELFIRMSPAPAISRKALLRRVAISIQNFRTPGCDDEGQKYLSLLFKDAPRSWPQVNKIMQLPDKIVDPDKTLFEPIDQYCSLIAR